MVSELRLTASCVLMDLASLAVSGTSVYANGLRREKQVSDYTTVYKIHSLQHYFEIVTTS